MTRPAFLASKWTRRALAAAFFIAVFLVLSGWRARELATGPAPMFEVLALDEQILSPARFAGRPQVIYFWTTWCPVCKAQRGAIESVAEDYPVIALALGETDAQIRDYLDGGTTALRMAADSDGRIARRYGVQGVPAIFIVDGEGNIVSRQMGYTTELGIRLRLFLSGD